LRSGAGRRPPSWRPPPVLYAAIARRFITDFAALAKIHLVASESTITALMAYQKAFTPAFLELIELRGPLVNRKRAIDLEQTFMDAAIAEHKQIVQLMKEHNISGSADIARLERLKLQGDKIMSRHNTHNENQASQMGSYSWWCAG
jgi:hypothetical protein